MTDYTAQIASLLRNGPLTREQIAAILKLELGTVSLVLGARKCFVRNDDGKWTVRRTNDG